MDGRLSELLLTYFIIKQILKPKLINSIKIDGFYWRKKIRHPCIVTTSNAIMSVRFFLVITNIMMIGPLIILQITQIQIANRSSKEERENLLLLHFVSQLQGIVWCFVIIATYVLFCWVREDHLCRHYLRLLRQTHGLCPLKRQWHQNFSTVWNVRKF